MTYAVNVVIETSVAEQLISLNKLLLFNLIRWLDIEIGIFIIIPIENSASQIHAIGYRADSQDY